MLNILIKISLWPVRRIIDFEDIQVADLFLGKGSLEGKEFLLYLFLYLFSGLILSGTYFTYFHGSTGQTIGKGLLKIKVIETSGEAINYKIAFIRWMGYFLSEIIMFLGFIWVVFDKNKQGWHDKIAGTYVVKVEKSYQ